MLHPVREERGLGNPPSIFTTNASKSMHYACFLEMKARLQKARAASVHPEGEGIGE